MEVQAAAVQVPKKKKGKTNRYEFTEMKYISFQDTVGNVARLAIKLKCQYMRRSEFMLLMVEKYLEDDERILEIIDEHNVKHGLVAKRVIAEEKREKKKKRIEMEKFNLGKAHEEIYDVVDTAEGDLSSSEKDDLYDIIEAELDNVY